MWPLRFIGRALGLLAPAMVPSIIVRNVEYETVICNGVELPLYTEAYVRKLFPAQLREHANLLFAALGQRVIGSRVPQADSELLAWILHAYRQHSAVLRGNFMSETLTAQALTSAPAFSFAVSTSYKHLPALPLTQSRSMSPEPARIYTTVRAADLIASSAPVEEASQVSTSSYHIFDARLSKAIDEVKANVAVMVEDRLRAVDLLVDQWDGALKDARSDLEVRVQHSIASGSRHAAVSAQWEEHVTAKLNEYGQQLRDLAERGPSQIDHIVAEVYGEVQSHIMRAVNELHDNHRQEMASRSVTHDELSKMQAGSLRNVRQLQETHRQEMQNVATRMNTLELEFDRCVSSLSASVRELQETPLVAAVREREVVKQQGHKIEELQREVNSQGLELKELQRELEVRCLELEAAAAGRREAECDVIVQNVSLRQDLEACQSDNHAHRKRLEKQIGDMVVRHDERDVVVRVLERDLRVDAAALSERFAFVERSSADLTGRDESRKNYCSRLSESITELRVDVDARSAELATLRDNALDDAEERVAYLDKVFDESASKHAKWETSLSKLAKFQRDVEQHISQQGAVQERLRYVEEVFSESIEKHSREINARGQHHCGLEDRLCHLEKSIGSAADRHAKLDAAHAWVSRLSKDTETRYAQHADLRERIEYVEKLLVDSAVRHAKWEASHSNSAGLENAVESSGQHHAGIEERLEYVEKFLGDLASNHAKWEAAHSVLAKLENDFNARETHHKERVESVEKCLEDTSGQHAMLEVSQEKIAKLNSEHEGRFTHYIRLQERMTDLEHLCRDMGSKHARWESSHAELSTFQRDVKQHASQHASIHDRVRYVEDALGEVADKHARWDVFQGKVARELDAHGKHHVGLGERMEYLEKLLGDIHSTLAKWKVCHSRLATIEEELNAKGQYNAGFEERMTYLENSFGDSATRHAELENTFKLSKERDEFVAHHADLCERVEYVERLLGDSADKHSKWEATHSKLVHFEKELEVRGLHHAGVVVRLAHVEKRVGDSADNDVKLETAHGRLAKLEMELDVRRQLHAGVVHRMEHMEKLLETRGQHANVEQRIEHVEMFIRDSVDRHAKLEASHSWLAKLVKECETHALQYAALRESVAWLERHQRDAINPCGEGNTAKQYSGLRDRLRHIEEEMSGVEVSLPVAQYEDLCKSVAKLERKMDQRENDEKPPLGSGVPGWLLPERVEVIEKFMVNVRKYMESSPTTTTPRKALESTPRMPADFDGGSVSQARAAARTARAAEEEACSVGLEVRGLRSRAERMDATSKAPKCLSRHSSAGAFLEVPRGAQYGVTNGARRGANHGRHHSAELGSERSAEPPDMSDLRRSHEQPAPQRSISPPHFGSPCDGESRRVDRERIAQPRSASPPKLKLERFRGRPAPPRSTSTPHLGPPRAGVGCQGAWQ